MHRLLPCSSVSLMVPSFPRDELAEVLAGAAARHRSRLKEADYNLEPRPRSKWEADADLHEHYGIFLALADPHLGVLLEIAAEGCHRFFGGEGSPLALCSWWL